ncbi:REP-associated tyrosine transposase [Gracilimonas sp.]|uniref:REP-associated tyrosine transposase n=1 Tax=Gracilimonas sp. TaxID=1974203 RepID=UPI0028715E27|nr:transposase [Gracilimonas sp.]
MGRSRYKIHEEHYPYFITSTIKDGLPLLSNPKLAKIFLDSFTFLQAERKILIYGYVIMENHFHAIVKGEDLAKKLRLAKSFMARKMVDTLRDGRNNKLLSQIEFRKLKHKLKCDYQVWEEGLHPKQLFNDVLVTQKLEYIHLNPVKRGFVDRPEHWRYSSARNYLGVKGLIPVTIYSG